MIVMITMMMMMIMMMISKNMFINSKFIKNIAVVGAGPGGLGVAAALKQLGYYYHHHHHYYYYYYHYKDIVKV